MFRRWNLQRHLAAVGPVPREIDMAAAARMQLAQNAVAGKLLARLEPRRGRKSRLGPNQVGNLADGQTIDLHDLDGEIVLAAVLERCLDNRRSFFIKRSSPGQ